MTLFIFQIKMYKNLIHFVTNFWSTEQKNGKKIMIFKACIKHVITFYFMMVEISITQNVRYHEYLTMLPRRKDISFKILTKYYST